MKKNKLIIFILIVCLAPIFPVLYAQAGTRVWGPVKFVRGTGAPTTQFANFTTNPKGEFWITIDNGGSVQKPGAEPGIVEPVNLVSSAVVMLNNTAIATPNNFNQQATFIQKDISLQAQNTISVELAGAPGGYITLQIWRKSEENLNGDINNATGDVWAENFKDSIALWWVPEDKADQYVIYRAYSKDGPWTELFHFPKEWPLPAMNGTSEAATTDLYYRIEALDSNGDVIKRYAPLCVPKYKTVEDGQ